jgi:hypothetical protein
MRLALMFAVTCAFVVAASPGHAASCPSNAFRASTAIWKFGDIPTGQTRTARHPCGKQITCVGGKINPPKILRRCHWD